MRIVMIGPFGLRPRGTMSVRALPLAQALVARGHSITLLLPPWQNPADAGQCWNADGVHVENVVLPTGVPGWFHWRLTTTLVRRAAALKPDVVHTFKPKAYAGLAHLALRRHFPVVVDTDDWEGYGGWNDLNPYPALLKRFFAWQERWGLTHAAAVTVASHALQTLVWAMGGPPERVFYLPNGCVPRPAVPRLAHNGGRPTLLLYTRFFEYKVERLWRIVAGVKARLPEVRLWVVGKGFFAEEDSLLALARAAGWRVAEGASPSSDADLVYAGLVPPEDLPPHFAQADVALYPFDDTLLNRTKCPVKLLDLLAAGVPVVADAVGQVTESIRHGETGLLVPSGDDAAFVEAVTTLLRKTALRQSLGERAARDVRDRCAWEVLAPVAEAAYRYACRIP
ncbi:MAG TPA: glycosyltransferase family 4 protein [Anaerolineae bacterium]|nr:glycosyltransferase family 4 protein [Anaerolineae bacterium]HQH39939.1 glycosyltransferase family 4 protein [Anaerolineae bacterium]